jgi:AraC-like DNA-binding protein
MIPDIILYNATCTSFFLLAFISFFNPLKVNIIANKWFALFLFSVGCALLNVIIYTYHAEQKYMQILAFNELSRFTMAPALYLSVLHFTSPDKVFRKKEYLHFIPFAVFFFFTASFVVKPHASIFNPQAIPGVVRTVIQIFIVLSIPIQVSIYWALAYYKLVRHQKNMRLITSNTTPVNLNWLKFLLLGILVLILFSFNDRVFRIQLLKTYIPLGYLAGTLAIAYFLLAQKEIYPYDQPELEDINLLINDDRKKSLVKQRFSNENLIQLKSRLTRLMEAERLFLNNELGLPDLAEEMAISVHDLSYLLNEGFGMNFFQFINTYRIKEAKRLLLSEKYKHLNILGIAYNAGFNSKTTFNTAFKKETGLSPSQYMQQVKTGASTAGSFQ